MATRHPHRGPRGGAQRPGRTVVRPEHARSCVGCGVRAERPKGSFELVRFAILPVDEGGALRPIVDLAGSSFGRGAWVHPTRRCFEDAVRRGFSRAVKREVTASVAELASSLGDAAGARAHQLLAVGVRARKVAVGATAVDESDSKLTVIATDAAAQREVDVAKALASGRAIAFGTKDSLGAACGREVVAVVAVTDDALASAVRDAVALSLASATIRGL
ncbi:MAG: DUF448 domain-containing protein [Deltaproteobacteria bacterium]|nr:DUF448 domain-containing protein [Deltaproteobacteria bacterium]